MTPSKFFSLTVALLTSTLIGCGGLFGINELDSDQPDSNGGNFDGATTREDAGASVSDGTTDGRNTVETDATAPESSVDTSVDVGTDATPSRSSTDASADVAAEATWRQSPRLTPVGTLDWMRPCRNRP